ncbi:AAA family ATPase [Pseudoramibacter porci]|uniref:ATP-binding protein n=1 Tax=Pseudoramibacter porci TaxID=2606631 RepID=A0A7X2TAC0_9FIRM|nr:ATP-binding protein [Pseudoramibacter porci]MSS19658.1 ATP-binding protein [Pseudoramibacter porci]
MRFIGRKQELKQLTEAWKKEDALILITGRPRFGKTRLIKEFVKDKNHLYFEAGAQSDRLNRVAFERVFKSHFGIQAPPSDAAAMEWLELFRLYSEKTEDGGKILVIDNFDQLYFENKSFLKIFKKAWQKYFKVNGVTVMAVAREAAWNRVSQTERSAKKIWTDQIHLTQMSFAEMMSEYPHHDFNQLMIVYAITGGVPGYWHFFNHCVNIKQIKKSILQNILNPYGKLFAEVSTLLETEVWRPNAYHAVLSSMTMGKKSLEQIRDMTGYKKADVRKILFNLEGLGYIEEVSYLQPKKTLKKKSKQYQIALPFVDFWYTFVFPEFGLLKDDFQYYKRQTLSGMIPYIKKWFNKILIEIIKTASIKKKIGIEIDEVGGYTENDQWIPILAFDHSHRKMLIADCVYDTNAYGKLDFEKFKEKSTGLEALNKKYSTYERVYGVFSVYPFEKDLLDFALEASDLFLFNGLSLYSLK